MEFETRQRRPAEGEIQIQENNIADILEEFRTYFRNCCRNHSAQSKKTGKGEFFWDNIIL